MSKNECEMILNASPIHDVGKIGIPDRVLLKPRKLNEEEWEIMKTHPKMGEEILKMSQTVDITHHEGWDGGLKADVFDALTSEKPFKKTRSVEDAIGVLEAESEKHFDPNLVPLFKEILPQILKIKERFCKPEK